jgi:mannosyltransferase
MKLKEKHWLAILTAICLVYILLRFWNLTASCLWFDEIFGVHAAAHEWQNLFGFVAQDLIHPPLFYVFLKIWISIGGESLFWLRFFSVFFSIVALLPFYFLCRALKLSYATIALAFVFFAVNGSLIKYAQEIRMYSLLLCLSLFSMWVFVRFLNLGKSFWILTFLNVLLVYTHYFGWLLVVAEVCAILILQRIKIRQILIMFGINLLAFAPWIFAVWKASRSNADLAQNIGWISKPNFSAIFQFIFDLIEPFYFQQSNKDATSLFYITIPILLIIITALVFYLVDWRNKSETRQRDFLLLLLFIKVPVLLALAASWIFPYSIWGARHLIIVFAPMAILASILINKIKIEQLKTGLIALLFFLFGAAFALQIKNAQTKFIWCAWENLASKTDAGKAQKIYAFEDLSAYILWFSLRESDRFQVFKVNIEGLAEDKSYFLPRGFDQVRTTDASGIEGERFWIAFRDKEFNLSKPPLSNLIEKGYKIGEPEVFQAQGMMAFLVLVEK